jgi:hypothetical protein
MAVRWRTAVAQMASPRAAHKPLSSRAVAKIAPLKRLTGGVGTPKDIRLGRIVG